MAFARRMEMPHCDCCATPLAEFCCHTGMCFINRHQPAPGQQLTSTCISDQTSIRLQLSWAPPAQPGMGFSKASCEPSQSNPQPQSFTPTYLTQKERLPPFIFRLCYFSFYSAAFSVLLDSETGNTSHDTSQCRKL